MNWRLFWKKTWYFIWESESILSWIINIILAFVIIKFIVYPGLGFIMQTNYPVVAVVSGSMEHKIVHECLRNSMSGCAERNQNIYDMCGFEFNKSKKVDFDVFWEICGPWYEKNTAIKKDDFSKFSFKNGFNTGDIMVLVGPTKENTKLGDIVVYMSKTAPYPIIHRIVDIKSSGNHTAFTTKGDHNSGADPSINEKQLVGKAVFRIPLLGWVKIGAVKLIEVFIGA